jgi:AcrR family transcriptional regulator
MILRTASMTAATTPPPSVAPQGEGLRERKKRLMRQQLSDTATQMFLERGFDAVRVSQIAEACGVSEQTVFNYFPTKESLLLDRSDANRAALRAGLSEAGISPVTATLTFLANELAAEISWLASQEDQAQAITTVQRFDALIETTASLRAHQRDQTDQLVSVAAEILAERAGVEANDPRPRIAATALLGLVEIQARALKKHLQPGRTLDQVQEAVTADVQAAARLIEGGLRSYPPGRKRKAPRNDSPW